jgi:hypothetical protein
MKVLSDDSSQSLRGGRLVSLTIPISLNGVVAPQTNAGAGVAVAALGSTANGALGQANGLAALQRALTFSI